MEILVWISKAMIPLLGWLLISAQFQKAADFLQQKWSWNENFQNNFLKSLVLTFCHATPESHLQVLQASSLPLRIRLLWIGIRSLSFGLIFLLVFAIGNFVPASVFLILGFFLFVGAQWWKPLKGWALLALGIGMFLTSFEWLLQNSSRLTEMPEEQPWIFALSHNYFAGALIGVGIGFLIRMVTRFSGVAWWSSTQLLLAGILSLGSAWGFILGDFIAGFCEDFVRYRSPEIRTRTWIGLIAGALALILSAPFQSLIMIWINGQYSVQLRMLQLASMVFVFLLLESVVALTVFHFEYLKRNQKNA